tara:strand:+ start:2202 stop:2384 length:183 start_codon:yes stop_codon:yes gene_type:complete
MEEKEAKMETMTRRDTFKANEAIKGKESIVVSYKAIGINTYNVFVIDLKTRLIKYWHEGF